MVESNKEFVVDQVSWHTEIRGNPETSTRVKQRFRILVDFLQTNGLTTKELLPPLVIPDDTFAIHTLDLTKEGFEVIRYGYPKWLKKIVNRNKDISDVSLLESSLREIKSRSDASDQT